MPKLAINRKRNTNKATQIRKAKKNFGKAVRNFGKLKPIVKLACKNKQGFGLGPEALTHTGLVSALKILPKNRTRNDRKSIKNLSEEIGELAAKYRLMAALEKQGVPFEEAGLFTFSAAGVFNLVYLSPTPTTIPDPNYKPVFVFIMEAKGGTSECKDRRDGKGSRVMQGTLDYARVVGTLMAKSNYKKASKATAVIKERERRRLVGKAVLEAMKNNTGVYAGVRGAYTTDDLYQPEMIFSVPF